MDKIVITITQDSTGQVSVNGPLENRVICFGLLEFAKEVINKYHVEKEKNQIVVPELKMPFNPNGN